MEGSIQPDAKKIYLITLGVNKYIRQKPTTSGYKQAHDRISGTPSSINQAPYSFEGILTKVHKRAQETA